MESPQVSRSVRTHAVLTRDAIAHTHTHTPPLSPEQGSPVSPIAAGPESVAEEFAQICQSVGHEGAPVRVYELTTTLRTRSCGWVESCSRVDVVSPHPTWVY